MPARLARFHFFGKLFENYLTKALSGMELYHLRAGVVLYRKRERPLVSGIYDAGEVDRESFAVDRGARIENAHQVVGNFYRFECGDENILLRQEFEALPLLKLNHVEIFWAVVFQGVDAQSLAAARRHFPRFWNEKRKAETEVDGMRLYLKTVEAGRQDYIPFLHPREYFVFGQDCHGTVVIARFAFL